MKSIKQSKILIIILSVILIFTLINCGEQQKDNKNTNDKTDKTEVDKTEVDKTEVDKTEVDKTETKKEMIFRFNNGTEPQTLDPGIMTGVPESRLAYQLFEGLTNHNPEDLSPEPGVAESWELSEDGLTWTFYLRKNAKWSDGTPITAETFKYSWLRALSPETASQYAQFLWDIENAEQYTSGEITDTSLVGIEVVNDYELKVRLKTPVGYFLHLTCFSTFYPVPQHIIEKYGNEQWYKKENIVSNGAFIVKEWIPQNRMELVPNPQYWDREKVKLDKIIVYPYEDGNTSLEMYLNGELDWTTTVPVQRMDEMKDKDDFHNSPYLGTYYYRFNVLRAPFDDVRVRKALAMTIDRNRIVRYITKAGEKPAYSFVPPTIPGWTYRSELKEDIEEAKRLLAEAGYPNGEGFPKMTLLYNTSDRHKPIAEAIVQMWKENLGIDMAIENQEWQVYLDLVHNLDYDIARAGWIGDYVDPNTFSDMMTTDNGNNNTGWSNERYDELVLKLGKYETDPEQRYKYFEEAEAILMEELPIIPIYSYMIQWMLNPQVEGIYGNIRDVHPLKEVYIRNK
jgi:oligopeptide transport system substrate-binding protein